MATVEIHGPKLPGKRKYLGGAPTLEGDALLGVPAHATAVLKLELATGAVTLDESGNLRSPRTRDRSLAVGTARGSGGARTKVGRVTATKPANINPPYASLKKSQESHLPDTSPPQRELHKSHARSI